MEKNNISITNLISILDCLPDRLYILSEDGEFLDVYGGAETHVEFTDSNYLIGKKFHDLFDTKRAEIFHNAILNSIKTHETQTFIYYVNEKTMPYLSVPFQSEQWYEGRIQELPEKINGKKSVIWAARNITKSERIKQQLKRLSEQDELTQIQNKRAFNQHLQLQLDTIQNKKHSVIIFDIDLFKQVNDNFGHLAGDFILKEIAAVLNKHTRSHDHVGRIGGEEFAILLQNMSQSQASIIAERIRQAVENKKFIYQQQHIPITISGGVSQLLAEDDNIDMVIQRADKALYLAKHLGRNNIQIFHN